MSVKENVALPEGYIMRPPQMSDLENVVALLNAHSMALHGREEYSLADKKVDWHLEEFTLENHSRVITSPTGQIVGYMELWDGNTPPVHMYFFGCTHPHEAGKGVGSALFQWVEKQARLSIPRCPADARVVLNTKTEADHLSAQQFFEKFGMKEIRRSWKMLIEMQSQPAIPDAPAGIQLRPYQHPADLDILVAAHLDSFRDAFGYVERVPDELKSDYLEWVKNDEEADTSMWTVATDKASGDVAGFAVCRCKAEADPEAGEITILGVPRAWRRRGIAQAMLYRSFAQFWQRGIKKVMLNVDADSLTGANKLYQKVGMHIHREFITYEKELRPGKELATKEIDD